MASSSVQIRVEGERRDVGGGLGAGAGKGIPCRPKGLRKSFSHREKPSTNASIPSRYQVSFYTSSEAQGFSSQAPRFQDHLQLNDAPGPGSYLTPHSTLNTYSTSTSTAGRGDFASKSHRFRRERHTNAVIGPGSYNPHLLPERQDFSSATVSRFFQKPIAVKPVDGGSHTCLSPSPATYHPSHAHTEHNHLVTAQAAFKSRTARNVPSSFLSSNVPPSPGHYHIRDDLLHPTPSPHCSVFSSKSRRNGLGKPHSGPGPADYTPHHSTPTPTTSTTTTTTTSPPTTTATAPYHRQKHYLRISAPALPLPPLPPSPGPGHYETQQPPSQPVKKKDACGFSSNADRWKLEVKSDKDSEPGPGSYDPMLPLRKSYLYNIQRKWI